MRSRLSKGLIIPTAMFVAMFVLLLVTCIMASVSHNFNMSLRSVENTEFRYISFATANELISNLNGTAKVTGDYQSPPVRDGELEYDTFTKDDPWVINNDGRITETWVEPLDDEGKTVVVVSQTYRGGPSTAQVVKRVARFKSNTIGRVYTNAPDENKNSPDPIYYSDLSDSGAWSELPPVPRMRYKSDGTLEYKEGEHAGSLPYLSGSPDGSLYSGYSPAMDGWGDPPSPVFFIPILQGDLCLKTVIRGAEQGKTVGDLQPILQVLIDVTPEVTLSKGSVPLKFDHDSGSWEAMPLPNDVRMVDGKFEFKEGDYVINGVPGPPAAFNGGAVSAMYLKGQDAVYRYDEGSGYTVLTPPGQDVMLLAADESGTTYVQTGKLQPVGIGYLLNIIAGNLDSIYANTNTSALSKYEEGQWHSIPDPPAEFYDKDGNLVADSYPRGRGPTLGGMVGGEQGEFTVINRPDDPNLVDTIYRYKDGQWEAVPSPPNQYFDDAGNEVTEPGLPSRLEVGMGSKGKLMLRIPSTKGGDAIFEESDTEGEFNLLPAVMSGSGSFVPYLFQMTGGEKRDGSGKGTFHVTATYL